MRQQFTTKNFFNVLIIATLFIFSACKKEYADYSYSNILSFSIKNTDGTSSKAAITAHEITLYWPPFQTVPDSITPNIQLAERATISPASGTKVAFKETTKFTVTAQNGSKTVYTLNPSINQPIPYITEISKFFSYDFNGTKVFFPNAELQISGDYFVADSLLTNVYLTVEGSKDINVPYYYVSTSGIGAGEVSEMIKTGVPFKVKVVTGSRTILSGACVLGEYLPSISVNTIYGKSYKPGDTFTVEGINVETISALTIGINTTSAAQNLIVQSKVNGVVTIKIPETIPPGVYTTFNYTYDSGTYHNGKTNLIYGRITIK